MNAAIIDSGIHMDRAVNADRIIDCRYYCFKGQKVVGEETERCFHEHGTLVYNTIQKYAGNSDVGYSIYNIIDEERHGGSELLNRALRDILDKKSINVVVMSLTFRNQSKAAEIRKTIKALRQNGTIMIAADSNSASPAYPAAYPEVLGVGRGGFIREPAYIYRPLSEIRIAGDILPEFLREQNGRHRLFSGTSKAAAKFAAYVIHAWSRGLWEAGPEHYLEAHTLQLADNILVDICKGCEAIKAGVKPEVIDVVTECVNEYRIRTNQQALTDVASVNPVLLHSVQEKGFDLLIRTLLERYQINIPVEKVNYIDFRSLYDLINFVAEHYGNK